MKFRIKYLLIFSIALLYSCGQEEVKKEEILIEPPLTSQLINWSVMNADGWKNMSFPTWFSKELIDSNDIKTILIGFTNFNFTDSIVNITDTMPYRTLEINFDQKGSVKKVVMAEFIDGIQLAQHIFSYKSGTDSLGYSTPAVSSNVKYREKSMISLLNTLQELQQYQRLVLEESDEKLLKYVDKSSKKEIYHYFILDTANWNVSYIDHNFNPEGKHLFYYGSPTDYLSSFSLVNLVEKSLKQSRIYYPSKALKSQSFHTKDFTTKRCFDYDSTGVLMSIKDSLVSASDEFLHSDLGIIKYKNFLPSELNFFNADDTLRKVPVKRVSFKYN
ncbi:hypothetical protein ERX46_08895 [Brumimicrobium glaciale]|uniref:Uncharacterized protein n=1 Tax=Brumimicrobium glaciale TaxID=200475 RepID=A0A4Q4KLV2_9FLAO|nr:hypothetical protein [Brumimicrobium glaciale]RYM34068.1 hypothetical protein ERX46_08895 [Brumimicrobium glaciale]